MVRKRPAGARTKEWESTRAKRKKDKFDLAAEWFQRGQVKADEGGLTTGSQQYRDVAEAYSSGMNEGYEEAYQVARQEFYNEGYKVAKMQMCNQYYDIRSQFHSDTIAIVELDRHIARADNTFRSTATRDARKTLGSATVSLFSSPPRRCAVGKQIGAQKRRRGRVVF